MKRYFLVLFTALSMAGCEKYILNQYGEELYGDWKNTSIQKLGVQGNFSGLDFNKGSFIFNDDGTMKYTDAAGNLYKGKWVTGEDKEEDCYTAPDGSQVCTHTWIKNLQLDVTAVNNSQQKKSAYFYEVNIYSDHYFKAKIKTDFYTQYEYEFRR